MYVYVIYSNVLNMRITFDFLPVCYDLELLVYMYYKKPMYIL